MWVAKLNSIVFLMAGLLASKHMFWLSHSILLWYACMLYPASGRSKIAADAAASAMKMSNHRGYLMRVWENLLREWTFATRAPNHSPLGPILSLLPMIGPPLTFGHRLVTCPSWARSTTLRLGLRLVTLGLRPRRPAQSRDFYCPSSEILFGHCSVHVTHEL